MTAVVSRCSTIHRPGERQPGPKALVSEDRRLDPVAELRVVHRPRPVLGRLEAPASSRELIRSSSRLGPEALSRQFRASTREIEGEHVVELGVQRAKDVEHGRGAVGSHLVGEWHFDFVGLPDVAHVDRTSQRDIVGRDARVGEQLVRSSVERSSDHRDLAPVDRAQLPEALVCTRCTAEGAISSPKAEVAPAPNGTTTSLIEVFRASAQACAGAAPPKATSVYRRGSRFRSTKCVRIAAAMFSLTIS